FAATALEDLVWGFAPFPVQEGTTPRVVEETTGEILFKRGPANHDTAGGDYLSLHEKIPGSSFVIESLVPDTYLTKDAGRLGRVIFALCALSFLVMTVIGYVVARLSGRKMSRIVGLVRSFQEGNFQKRIRFSGNDEFVQIADSFNVMATNIKELINSGYLQGIQTNQAAMEARPAT
ncbi:sensor with HAMP domain protein, partial [Paenibacillus riograndensis]